MKAHLPIDRHPCFNAEVKGHCGRVHLPVAPKCNIRCNYCNRKYDCVNESRPGVTSAILAPRQALGYLEKILEREPRITVVGIAGPGDPFANAEETLETMRLIRERFPEMLLCVASNGLNVLPHLDELAAIGATHVTITVNAVDPEIGRHIYAWVRDGKVVYRGPRGAELLLSRQLQAIKGLKERGIVVKVNTIVIPEVNDHHVEEVAARMAELGVDLLNCMPMYPNADTPFADVEEHPPRVR
jgi:nitrogen fixation protein NifB